MTEELLRVLGIVFISAFICVVLKQKSPEFSLLLAVISACVAIFMIIKQLTAPIAEIKAALISYGVESAYFKVALKAVGIGYITSFVASSCRDAGQNSLAQKAELAGKAAIFVLSVPLVLSILNTAVGFINV